MKTISLFLVLAVLTSCATSPPRNTSNVCSMFEERRSWYKAAVKSEKRWGVPVPIVMAFIHQESSYQSRAKPPRKKYLGFIPGPRPSSAFGYAQVLDTTWAEYEEKAGRWGARRSNFADAADFIGWYNSNSYRRNGIRRDDAYSLYLAYHEGNGGFSRRSYADKPDLIDTARQVQANARTYERQFQQCERELGRNWFMRLLF
ncbi:MAG: hypothetical protein RQ899_08875 [Pseudomonadales bacterium]|nr:hypothetical protein [Pseudomonadales bacterium]